MASASIPKDRRTARIVMVEQHIRLENEHSLEGVLRTFGATQWIPLQQRGKVIEFSLPTKRSA